jgi:hypothetical protein
MKRALIVLALVAIFATSFYIHSYRTQKAEIERLSLNLEQYGLNISHLQLNNREIRQELAKNNSALVAADSILDARNRRIEQLEKLVATRIVIRDTVPILVPLDVPVDVTIDDTTKYKSSFSSTASCITLKGYILSSDPRPALAITERSADVQVYDIRIKRRWWQLWRPREERIIETNCGDVEIITINKQ